MLYGIFVSAAIDSNMYFTWDDLVQANCYNSISLATVQEKVVRSQFGPMIHEKVLLRSSRKEKPVPFPLNKEKMGSTITPVFITTEKTSFKDEAKNANGRGKRKHEPGSLVTTLSSINPLWSLLGLVRIICFLIVWVSFGWDFYYLQQKGS